MPIDDKILSINHDDDNKDYNLFNKYLEDDTNRKKSSVAMEIEQIGDQLLNEIENKRRKKKNKIEKLILYIIKNSNYCVDELNSYSFDDVQKIYNEIKKEKKPIILKIFHFIFNVE